MRIVTVSASLSTSNGNDKNKKTKELSFQSCLSFMKMRTKNEKTMEKMEEELVLSDFFLDETSNKEKKLQMKRN